MITSNTDIQGSSRLAYVGSNYYEGGRTAGGLMRLVTEGKANLGIITGSSQCCAIRNGSRAFWT